MTEAEVVLPNDEFFPDPYDMSTDSAQRLFNWICTLMRVDPSSIVLDLFPDVADELREVVPVWSSRGQAKGCAAGIYYLPDELAADKRAEIALQQSLLKEPAKLIATIAHEVGHAILLGGKLIATDTSDHEPLTDLLTVFVGLGIFGANSSAHFRQFTEPGRQGWSMSRLGYLGQEMFGYALAKFAIERGEPRPEWARFLSTNVRVYFKRSSDWLMRRAS